MRVRFTERARRDIEVILDYLTERSPQGSANVKRSVKTAIEVIGEYPDGGRLVGEEGVRVLPAGRYPFLIYWSVEAGEAWILHIRDARRRLWERE